jgi:hypothetical protein
MPDQKPRRPKTAFREHRGLSGAKFCPPALNAWGSGIAVLVLVPGTQDY